MRVITHQKTLENKYCVKFLDTDTYLSNWKAEPILFDTLEELVKATEKEYKYMYCLTYEDLVELQAVLDSLGNDSKKVLKLL